MSRSELIAEGRRVLRENAGFIAECRAKNAARTTRQTRAIAVVPTPPPPPPTAAELRRAAVLETRFTRPATTVYIPNN
jgi:hypothetical protein